MYVSGILKTFAANLSKISNDLRLMSSGPQVGIGDIKLKPTQAGSSIMPGKVNPVIPEVVNQVAFNVIGNDMTVTMAVEAGQLELNAFEPIIFYNLFESLKTLKNAIYTLRVNCIDYITADRSELSEQVEKSIGLVTALAPHIGYAKASDIAHKALETGQSIRELVLSDELLSKEELEKLDYLKKFFDIRDDEKIGKITKVIEKEELDRLYTRLEPMIKRRESLVEEKEKLLTYKNNLEILNRADVDIDKIKRLNYFDFRYGEVTKDVRFILKNNYENIPSLIIHLNDEDTKKC